MGTELDPTSPQDNDIVATYPQNEQDERAGVKTLISKEHYEGTAGNDRHKLFLAENDAARQAEYDNDLPDTPQDGNFSINKGVVSVSNEPRIKGASYHDGTVWHKGLFLIPGMVIQCAFDPTTIETVSDGALLPAFGGAFSTLGAYAELFAVIGNNFDLQNGTSDPGVDMFRVPNIAGSMVIGISPDKDTPAAYMRNVSDTNDFRASGTYTGPTSAIYIIKITVAGPQDSFQFSSDGGANFSASIPIVAGPIGMDNNMNANFVADTGHLVGDTWIYVVDPGLNIIGTTGGASAWQLVETEIPKVTPTIPSSGSHTHTTAAADNGSGTDDFRLTDDFVGSNTIVTSASGSDHTHPVDEFGGDEAFFTTPRVLVFGSVIVT